MPRLRSWITATGKSVLGDERRLQLTPDLRPHESHSMFRAGAPPGNQYSPRSSTRFTAGWPPSPTPGSRARTPRRATRSPAARAVSPGQVRLGRRRGRRSGLARTGYAAAAFVPAGSTRAARAVSYTHLRAHETV